MQECSGACRIRRDTRSRSPSSGSAPSGTLPDQRTLSVALAGLLRLLTVRAPVLLAVDDAQWLDESSAAILAYAIRRLGEAPLAVLVSVRTGRRRTRVSVAGGPDAGSDRARPRGGDAARVAPSPVPAPAGPVVPAARARPDRSGVPWQPALRPGDRAGAPEAGIQLDPHAPLPIPDSLSALMATRVSALPARTQRILLLAAAAAEPSLETLERAMPDADDALRPAILAGVAMVDRGIVRFSHPLLAQAVIGSAAPDELRRVHGILAGVATSPDARARHLGHATDGPDEAVARALADAAGAARTRGATVDAAALYLDAAARDADGVVRSTSRAGQARRRMPVHRPVRDRGGGRDPRGGPPRGTPRADSRGGAEPARHPPLLPRASPGSRRDGRAGARGSRSRHDAPGEGPRPCRVPRDAGRSRTGPCPHRRGGRPARGRPSTRRSGPGRQRAPAPGQRRADVGRADAPSGDRPRAEAHLRRWPVMGARRR